ncbi:UDP-glucose 4-epimerase GalE [Fulvimarina sp. MAC3]|uniref:UDP-glucose 4-epimerase GalE n=1 Tax=Fulvimarina sp. MAC3 TaxID=3148887 RepID=UPI0031FBE84F
MTVAILVVGGAGYIGSHTCLDLSEQGCLPVTYDNLSNGHAEFVQWGPLETGELADTDRLSDVMAKYHPEAIVHFAGLIEVGQSVKDPLSFYSNNVSGTISLLTAAERNGIDKIVFSSTCATYGLPKTVPLSEDHPQAPINPYGHSKLLVETILRDCAAYRDLKPVILRYFNAAGADFEGRIGERHDPETHVVPIAIDVALGRRDQFVCNGTDYDTRDGSAVRDYVHVADLARAHSRAVSYLLNGGDAVTLNLGTGHGTTVFELVKAVERVCGRPFPLRTGPRREGDAPVLVADNRKARDVLDWAPKYDLDAIVQSAWNWHTAPR